MGRRPKEEMLAVRAQLPSQVLGVDQHVGHRVRLRRKILGLSQTALGDALGVAFQQVRKYERGANRISASTLYRLARVLEVDVSFFFEDLPAEGEDVQTPDVPVSDLYGSAEIVRLLSVFHRIPDQSVRESVVNLARELSSADDLKADGAQTG